MYQLGKNPLTSDFLHIKQHLGQFADKINKTKTNVLRQIQTASEGFGRLASENYF